MLGSDKLTAFTANFQDVSTGEEEEEEKKKSWGHLNTPYEL